MHQPSSPFPTRVVASCFALTAFAISIVSGLAADRAASSILLTSIITLVVCQIIGYAFGVMVQHAVIERMNQYARTNPIPVDAPDDRSLDMGPDVELVEEPAPEQPAGLAPPAAAA